MRYEVRDIQTLVGQLVDEGIVKPGAIGLGLPHTPARAVVVERVVQERLRGGVEGSGVQLRLPRRDIGARAVNDVAVYGPPPLGAVTGQVIV